MLPKGLSRWSGCCHFGAHAQALERLTWCARRWTIGSWHCVLKSGCRVEVRQFDNLDRFVRATALFAMISWRILYATLPARQDGDLPCEVLLRPVEWRVLHCPCTTRPSCLLSLHRWRESCSGSLGSVAISRASMIVRPGQPLYGAAFSRCKKSPRCIASSGKTNDSICG